MQNETPIPFENENPEAAKFMMNVYAVGGSIDLVGTKLRPKGLKRNVKCPCGSGLKVKKCHSNWLE